MQPALPSGRHPAFQPGGVQLRSEADQTLSLPDEDTSGSQADRYRHLGGIIRGNLQRVTEIELRQTQRVRTRGDHSARDPRRALKIDSRRVLRIPGLLILDDELQIRHPIDVEVEISVTRDPDLKTSGL